MINLYLLLIDLNIQITSTGILWLIAALIGAIIFIRIVLPFLIAIGIIAVGIISALIKRSQL